MGITWERYQELVCMKKSSCNSNKMMFSNEENNLIDVVCMSKFFGTIIALNKVAKRLLIFYLNRAKTLC